MIDVVKRLRDWLDEDTPIGVIMNEAADEIEQNRIDLEEYRRDVERLRAALVDPATVHINMLRGVIAKPTLAQIIHLYGKDAIRSALETPTASAAENTDE